MNTQFLSPVGRLVMGSLYKPSTKDADGNALVYKTGQPRVNYFLALAIPKGKETHWAQTEWGAPIYAAGVAAFPQAHKSPTFAWKVTDGDDRTPNSKGKSAFETEGFAGNWILRFSGSFAPKVYREDSGAYVQVTEEGYIKPGYFVQISGSFAGNDRQQRPGLYLNHSMVAFSAYGPEIHFGPDANSVGFGKAPLPAGASAAPLASAIPLPTAVAAANVVPNHAFLQNQAPSAVPPPPPPAPPAGPTMTAKAGASSYQAFKSGGWTDEALISQGYMTA